MNLFSESRREPRQKVTDTLVSIRAPILDTAGIASVDEETTFAADLVDISAHGAGILSHHFLSVGSTIYISCNERKYNFAYRPAAVRYIVLTPKGIRAGIEFAEPIKA